MSRASQSFCVLILGTAIFSASAVQANGDRFRHRGISNTAVTAWWVIFNDPAACASEAPDGGTCLIIPVADPPIVEDLFAANGCVTHATGSTVDRYGNVRLVASIYSTDPSGTAPCILGDGGLLNPLTAEVHLVVRGHQKKLRDRELFLDQITTFNGGCPDGPTPGPNLCADLQAAFHAPCDPQDADCDPNRTDRDVIWLPKPFLLAAEISERGAEILEFKKAGTSTLYRTDNSMTMVVETSLRDLQRIRLLERWARRGGRAPWRSR